MEKIRGILSIAVLFFISMPVAVADGLSLPGWEKWRTDYEHTIAGKDGWLSLAGLYWLSEGTNKLGSNGDNDHQFPADAPAYIGVIELNNGQIDFSTNKNIATINNRPAQQTLLSVADRTTVAFNHYEFYIIKRKKGFAIRLHDNAAENVKSFAGTRFTPFQPGWVVPAKLIRHKTPQTFMVPTVYGTNEENRSAGWLEFTINDQLLRLQAVDYGEDSPIFLMFSDTTSGDTSYGAGRYIEVEWPDENGATAIDFNRAYNPPCAYTQFATCPLTPRQNRLPIAIQAGELDVH